MKYHYSTVLSTVTIVRDTSRKKRTQKKREEERENSTTKDKKSILVVQRLLYNSAGLLISTTYFSSEEHFAINIIKHFALNKLSSIAPFHPLHPDFQQSQSTLDNIH